MKAKLIKRMGFSDRPDAEIDVTVLSFVRGRTFDVGRYSDNARECTIVVCMDALGRLIDAPIENIRIVEIDK